MTKIAKGSISMLVSFIMTAAILCSYAPLGVSAVEIFTDECADFSKVSSRSDGLEVFSDHGETHQSVIGKPNDAVNRYIAYSSADNEITDFAISIQYAVGFLNLAIDFEVQVRSYGSAEFRTVDISQGTDSEIPGGVANFRNVEVVSSDALPDNVEEIRFVLKNSIGYTQMINRVTLTYEPADTSGGPGPEIEEVVITDDLTSFAKITEKSDNWQLFAPHPESGESVIGKTNASEGYVTYSKEGYYIRSAELSMQIHPSWVLYSRDLAVYVRRAGETGFTQITYTEGAITDAGDPYKLQSITVNDSFPLDVEEIKISLLNDIGWTFFLNKVIVTYETAPSAPSGISLTKPGSSFVVSITGWNPEHRYQIWTYQEVESGIFASETEKQNQWILSKPYTLGSNRSTDPDENFAWRPRGFTVSDGVLQADIGPIVSVDSNYTMAVKVLDGSGNFIGQYKDTFTPAGVGEVVISKVTVDGQYADEKSFVKDIAGGAPVLFSVTGNGVQGTEYTAIIDQTGDVLPAGGDSLNEFSWDLSTMKPGSYSVTLTAAAGTSSDSRKVHFRLYKVDYDTPYGEMTGLTANGAVDGNSYKIELTPSVTAGGVFKYRLSEPWGPAIHYSDPYTIPLTGPIIDLTSIGFENYGVYQLATYVFRNGVSSADDGIIRTITNERPGGFTLGVQVNGQPAGTETIDGLKEQDMVISAAAGSAIPDPQYEYSFWRRDANGWVMIRGYAESGTVTWRPNRIGAYTIQVRARNAGGKTYEALKNIEFEITDKNESKANISSITINQAELDSAAARTPVMIKANAVSADGSEDQLYKFIISNGYIYYVETVYSADPTYIWVPGKSGNYTINVLVKSQASFGKYDVIESFVVSVD